MNCTAIRSIALALLLALGTPVAAQQSLITPFVRCIEIDDTPSTFRVYFGYESRNQSLASVPLGIANMLQPATLDGAPPTVFTPGYREKAFRARFAPSAAQPTLTWLFQGTPVSADWNTRRCGAVTTNDDDLYYRFDDSFE